MISELTTYIKNQKFILIDEVKNHVENSFEQLKKREWTCDLNISDFISDNYKRKQLFMAPDHPIPIVVLELVHRILKFMYISDMSFNCMDELLKEHPELNQSLPVYPSVQNILKLQSSFPVVYPNPWFWDFHGNYVDYLVEYVKWCWKDNIGS